MFDAVEDPFRIPTAAEAEQAAIVMCAAIQKLRGWATLQIGEDAEDCVQDACAAALVRSRKTIIRHPYTYAHSIFRHIVTHYITGKQRQREYAQQLDGELLALIAQEPGPNPEEEREIQERAELLERALALPIKGPRNTQVGRGLEILLRKIEGQHADEIKKSMGLTAGQYRVAKSLARGAVVKRGRNLLKDKEESHDRPNRRSA